MRPLNILSRILDFEDCKSARWSYTNSGRGSFVLLGVRVFGVELKRNALTLQDEFSQQGYEIFIILGCPLRCCIGSTSVNQFFKNQYIKKYIKIPKRQWFKKIK